MCVCHPHVSNERHLLPAAQNHRMSSRRDGVQSQVGLLEVFSDLFNYVFS